MKLCLPVDIIVVEESEEMKQNRKCGIVSTLVHLDLVDFVKNKIVSMPDAKKTN